MLSGRRTTYDILASLLKKISTDSISITELFYKMETSYSVLKNCVEVAIHFELAKQRGKHYQITQKGLAFIETWEKLQTFLKEG